MKKLLFSLKSDIILLLIKKGSLGMDKNHILDSIFQIKAIQSGQYDRGNKEWLFTKYHHSHEVLQAGKDILNFEKMGQTLSDTEKQIIEIALLLHDVGRAFEKNEDGSDKDFFLHGAEGMHFLKTKCKINEIAVLAAVMVHDQTDFLFLDTNEHALRRHPRFQLLPFQVKKSVLAVQKQYSQLSQKEKRFVKKVCHLVKDADTYANLKAFEKMFLVTKESKNALVSPQVLDQVLKKEYVRYKDVKTLPDRGMVYLAWMHHFHYPTTARLAQKERLPQRVKAHILSTLKQKRFSKFALMRISHSFDKVLFSLDFEHKPLPRAVQRRNLSKTH